METIPQLDSILEDTCDNDHSNEELLRLHSENIDLRFQLKELNQKLDLVLGDSFVIPRSSSVARQENRRKSVNSENKKSQSIKKIIALKKSKTNRKLEIMKNNELESLEQEASDLEEINKKLRRKIDQNIIENIDRELKPEFERIQKYFRLLFKIECISFHAKAEIEENDNRISHLIEVLNGYKLNFVSINGKELLVTQNNMFRVLNNIEKTKNDEIKALIMKEQNMKNEYNSLQNIIYEKTQVLKSLEQKNQAFTLEIKSLSTANEKIITNKRRTLSPQRLAKRINTDFERVPSADIFTHRIRPRYHSNKATNSPNINSEVRRSGKLEPLHDNEFPANENRRKTVNFEALKAPVLSDIFKNFNLSPKDFEHTHNFTLKASRPQN